VKATLPWTVAYSFRDSIGSSASAGLHADFVSAGTALYSLSGGSELQPAMRVSALVVGTKSIDIGSVSPMATLDREFSHQPGIVGIEGTPMDSAELRAMWGPLSPLGGAPRLASGARPAMNALVLDLRALPPLRSATRAVVFSRAGGGGRERRLGLGGQYQE
jgi:hypothetical protein